MPHDHPGKGEAMTIGDLRRILSGFAHDQPVPLEVAMRAFASVLTAAGCGATVDRAGGEPTILIRRGDGRLVQIDTEGAQEFRDWEEYRIGAGSYGSCVSFRSDD